MWLESTWSRRAPWLNQIDCVFDYSHNAPLSDEQLLRIEHIVNQQIRDNHTVEIHEGVSIDEARDKGAVALFGEKYGDTVRTVKAGPMSFELCGGNHVKATGEIGSFRVTSETGVAAGVRRIEAVVGHAADARSIDERQTLRAASDVLKTDPGNLVERVAGLVDEMKQLRKALDKARKSGGGQDIDAWLAEASQVDGVPVVARTVEVDARPTLAALVDRLRDKAPGAVIALGAKLDGAAVIIAATGPELKGDPRFHAGQLVKAITGQLDGRGGGRPDFAQGW